MTNDQIMDTFTGSTSKDVYTGMGMPGDQSSANYAALGDGGGKKPGAGIVQYGEGELLAQDRQKKYDREADYVGNSREEKEYRKDTSYGGPTKGNRGPGAMTQ